MQFWKARAESLFQNGLFQSARKQDTSVAPQGKPEQDQCKWKEIRDENGDRLPRRNREAVPGQVGMGFVQLSQN